MLSEYRMRAALQIPVLTLATALICATTGCQSTPPASHAGQHLTPAQAAGRDLFVQHCGECHEADSASGKKGPTMQGVFRKPYFPSGTPANDDRMRDVITMGRSNMPGYGRVLTPQQVDELIAYLHTL